ncbi:hypothetical protein [Streptomyces shenzhenensis]|uniref:hypothetical protein n=1 Tax=Streptomyces shenzhenensis TaxID=943815 RepID=UPI001F491D84|nr:hypothetical protein [Streptomyces shenzhenensis]
MDDLGRPSPKAMALRRPSLQPRPPSRPSRWQEVATQAKRHSPVDLAWCDTGTLCSLGLRPAMLNKVLALYGSSLVVTDAVAREIRAMANIPNAARTAENRLRCNSADAIVRKLDAGEIRELPLPATSETLDMLDRVLRQLDAIEQRQNATAGRSDDAVRSSQKHAGEAYSIVSAILTVGHQRSTRLLTNDNGATLVAERNGIAWKHTGQLLAELGCQDSLMDAELLYENFDQMTSRFATVPAELRPGTSDFFVCRQKDGICALCDGAI